MMMIWCFSPFQHYLSRIETMEGRQRLCNEAPYSYELNIIILVMLYDKQMSC